MLTVIRTTFTGFLGIFLHPRLLASILLTDLLPWYLWEEPKRLLRAYVGYTKAFYQILSVGFLLRTLFSPWKGIAEEYPNGFQWDRLLQALTLNIVTRAIGMIIRLVAIIVSLLLQVLLLAFFLVAFVAWFSFPLLIGVGFAFALSKF